MEQISEPQQPLLRVECYAGHRAEEEPWSFYIGDRFVTIDTIIDRWLSPEQRYFKVRGSDGGTYILCHDTLGDRWELTMYDRNSNSEPSHSST